MHGTELAMAKKIRRRSSAPKLKEQKAKQSSKTEKNKDDAPSIEEREAQAKKIKDVVPKVYSHRTGIDRLNSLTDYTEELKPNRLETLIARFYTSTEEELNAISKDPQATILERTLLQMFKESMDSKNKSKNMISKYLHSRIAGMPKKEIIFSGNVNQNLQYQTKKVPDIDSMDKDQRKAFREALESVSALPLKEIKVDTDDE